MEMTIMKRSLKFLKIFGIILSCILLSIMWYNKDHESLVNIVYPQSFKQRLQCLVPDKDIYKERVVLPTPVLILTYMRSGSTFLGDVIQSSDDVFYVFEPLKSLEWSKIPITDITGNEINGTFEEISNNVIQNIFRCQLRKLPRAFFGITAFLNISKTTQPFVKCSTNNTAIRCAELLEIQCRMSTHVVVKSIRLRAGSLFKIKKDITNLKIIHLQRDPRAVLQSQRKFENLRHFPLLTYVRSYCLNVTKDTEIICHLHECYSNDVFIIYYDRFGANTISFSRKLFRNLNLTFTAAVQKRIKELAEQTSNCTRYVYLCTKQFVTSTVIHLWMNKADLSFVRTVDNLCKDVYALHGYVSLPKYEMLTNLSYISQNTDLSTVPFLH